MRGTETYKNRIPIESLIFVNRNLRLSSIKMIGFDMDYTLAIYKYPDFEILAMEKTIERLVEKGYPAELFKGNFESGFLMRGLVVDKINGNILKLDKYNFVHRAMHGKRMLTYEERYSNYRNKKLDLFSEDFMWLDTLFSIPELAIIINAIDNIRNKKRFHFVKYSKLISDVRKCIDEVHQDNTLKQIVLSDIPKYIEYDPLLPPTLHRFKSNGKKLFLLTNSYWEYTNAVMSYLLSNRMREYKDWTGYFDIIIVGAKKPDFFNSNNMFYTVDVSNSQIKPLQTTIASFIKGIIYQGGNINDFERLSAIRGEQILYVGDHIYGDILSSKKRTLWRTCMIIPELEKEIKVSQENMKEIKSLNRMEMQSIILDRSLNLIKYNMKNEDGCDKSLRGDFEKLKRKHQRLIEAIKKKRDAISKKYNAEWGSLLREENELSKFGAQVEDYACIYTSKVSNFFHISPDQYLVSPPKLLPHELEIEELIR
ncbi:MAG: HAD-IG family 5'-nucleotidase [Deltaproteobacteria bacterium]|nr:HAD-IG family 5'-nucleotidase [Deltaproteobacteria bacterium]